MWFVQSSTMLRYVRPQGVPNLDFIQTTRSGSFMDITSDFDSVWFRDEPTLQLQQEGMVTAMRLPSPQCLTFTCRNMEPISLPPAEGGSRKKLPGCAARGETLAVKKAWVLLACFLQRLLLSHHSSNGKTWVHVAQQVIMQLLLWPAVPVSLLVPQCRVTYRQGLQADAC
ncbi:uncharacterized protein J5M81_010066 isoform 2-T3 [Pluvialis apricaria]